MLESWRWRRHALRLGAAILMAAPLLTSPASALAQGLRPSGGTSAAVPRASAVIKTAGSGGSTSFTVRIDGTGSFATSLPPSSVATYVLPAGGRTVREWLTAGTNTAQRLATALSPQPAIALGSASSGATLDVNPGDRKQTMTGFGAALTDSAAAVIDQAGGATANAIIADLFGPSGARLNMVRVPMGATDLIRPPYTNWSYDDLGGKSADPGLTRFTVAHDVADGLIPLLQKIRKAQPGLKLIGTPWSAPAWMKTNDSMTGGNCATSTLLPWSYPTYARYFVKFIQAYQNRYHLPVSMVSMQNEPENCKAAFPTMSMTEPEEAAFSSKLRAAFSKAHLTTKILGFDHNWYDGSSVDSYPRKLLSDPRSKVNAIGYHCYGDGGNVDAFTHQVSYRRTLVLMTECTGFMAQPGKPATSTAQNLVSEVRQDLLGPIRNSASGSLYWSLAMNGNGGPAQPRGGTTGGACQNCRGMITVGTSAQQGYCPAGAGPGYCLSEDYYYWGQFSRFVDPGAVVIGSGDLGVGSIETVAFRNPDGSTVVVALNSAPLTSYPGHIVQWEGDTKAQKTAWLVGPDGRRRWISDIATYKCLKANGAPGPDVLSSFVLDTLPDLNGVWAVCGADRIGVSSMLQRGFYARSGNQRYTLRLTAANLALTDASGHVVWQTGRGGDDLVLQSDGNLVEYSGSTPVWASSTVGSGAAWFVVRDDGKLALYNKAGTYVWTSEGPPAQYDGHIVQWEGDTKAQKTAWLVGPDGRRRWISDIATYNCLKTNGAPGPDVLTSWALNRMPDLNGVWAVCGADRIGVSSMLQRGFYARSGNQQYTLRLTASNLALTDPAGHVLWQTGRGGDDLVLQSDGNLVEYSGSTPVWASNTVGSGAAWFVVSNDGTLELYNSGGSQVWTSVNPAAYAGHIVEWVNGGGKPNTSWIVSSNGKRYWIPDTSTYWCMVNIGFSDLGPQSPGILNALPDSGQWAKCPVNPRGAQDTLSVGQGLYQGESITSLNGEYTLILQQDHNLVLYGPGGALWATGIWTGGYVVMQGDGNFVGYNQWGNPQWATNTGGAGSGCDLVVQNDANLVLYCGGVPKWDRYSGRLY